MRPTKRGRKITKNDIHKRIAMGARRHPQHCGDRVDLCLVRVSFWSDGRNHEAKMKDMFGRFISEGDIVVYVTKKSQHIDTQIARVLSNAENKIKVQVLAVPINNG